MAATGTVTATNVSTGKPNIAGAIYAAPKSSSLSIPTDATTALSSDFVCLGYVSEDGLENSNDMDTSTIKAWGGAIVYRSLTEMVDEFKFALIESENVHTLEAVYGADNVTEVDGAITINVKAENPEEKVWVFELALRGDKVKRIVVASGAVTAREPITYNDEDAIAYGLTVSAYPDADGVSHKEYIA